MRRFVGVLTALSAFFLLSTAARAAAPESLPDSTAADRQSVSVTVYNVNLALVRESRSLRIPQAGPALLRFMDVPSSINPRTVHLKSLTAPDDLTIREQNYEFDLISPDKLLEKYVGREVEIVEQAEDLTQKVVRATLLSTNGGPVYRVGDRIVLHPAGTVTLPSIPPDLVARPTLVWTLDADRAGTHDIEASYLTDGMTWSADYVAVVDADDRTADLTGWVTVENRSGASFANATLKLVAGDVRRVTPQADVRMERMQTMDMAAKAGGSQFGEEAFFEYHLYTLERPTTLKDNQTKQISLLQAAGVPLKKQLLLTGQPYWYRGQYGTLTQGEKVAVTLEIRNGREEHMGLPLPKGTVRVYKKDKSGSEQFVGEDAIDHTPRDEKVRLKVGDAFDVVADRTQTEFKVVGERRADSAYRVSLRNRKEEDVVVTVREPLGGDWKLLESSHPGKKIDAGTLEFEIPVPKGGETVLTYRVSVKW